MYKDPPWGSLPQHGSIPDEECRTLMNVLREFTSTPDQCFFCLWEGYGNIDTRLYKASARVKLREEITCSFAVRLMPSCRF